MGTPNYHILLVDDEPDVFEVTKMSLKGFKHNGRDIEWLFATSGKEALEIMRSRQDIAVIFMDVIMETPTAGLDACRIIRQEFKNDFVRILLRTGQPGVAPERKTIDDYDIDGYLPKAAMTSNRLYSSIRTALRAWDQLINIDRHQRILLEINNYALALRTFESIETTLDRILKTAVAICPTPLGLLKLETFLEQGNPAVFQLSTTSEAKQMFNKIGQYKDAEKMRLPTRIENGYFIPISLHGELGSGWIFLSQTDPDDLVRKALVLVAGHAENALYAVIARELLNRQRKEPFFNTMSM